MMLAKNKIIPDKIWEHDKELKNQMGETVENIFK